MEPSPSGGVAIHSATQTFPTTYGIHRFITMFTRAVHLHRHTFSTYWNITPSECIMLHASDHSGYSQSHNKKANFLLSPCL
jgi:hypothetical protein